MHYTTLHSQKHYTCTTPHYTHRDITLALHHTIYTLHSKDTTVLHYTTLQCDTIYIPRHTTLHTILTETLHSHYTTLHSVTLHSQRHHTTHYTHIDATLALHHTTSYLHTETLTSTTLLHAHRHYTTLPSHRETLCTCRGHCTGWTRLAATRPSWWT